MIGKFGSEVGVSEGNVDLETDEADGDWGVVGGSTGD